MKKLLSFIIAVFAGLGIASADGNWKMHPTFDEEISHLVETPKFVYFTSRNMAVNRQNDTYFALFRYEKEGDELVTLSTDNLLSSPLVSDIIYNPEKGYIAVVYSDHIIDLLYDNGKKIQIPYYSQASMSYSKNVNGMTTDSENDRIYLATDFGYVALNDKKGEIAESRIYGQPLTAFSRIGDSFLIIHDNQLKRVSTTSNRFNLDEYETVNLSNDPVVNDELNLLALYPLKDNIFLIKYNNGTKDNIKIASLEGNVARIVRDLEGPIYNVDYNSSGAMAVSGDRIYQVSNDGSVDTFSQPAEYQQSCFAGDNLNDFWTAKPRKGLSLLKRSDTNWNIAKDYMKPNSPAVFASSSYAMHPDKGLLVASHGMEPVTKSLYQSIPLHISGLKQGRWTNYSPAYTGSPLGDVLFMPNGIAVDPDNKSIVYATSPHHGLLRMNLDDPNDLMLMSRANDNLASKDWFVTLTPAPENIRIFTNLSYPYFDSKGNLWMAYADWDKSSNYTPQLYCWTAEDRRASTNPSNVRLPKLLEVKCPVTISNYNLLKPLLKSGNGLLVYTPSVYNDNLILINTNGTPLDSSDDKVYNFTEFLDTDGHKLEIRNINCIYEDPATGYVWIGHLNGVCYFIPSQVINNNNYQLTRIKVPRNDGTNLADYLLEGVTVNWIAEDNQGRKWFATKGAGLLCTSSDGREIIMEFTAENSPLPDNTIYSITYNSEANSMIMSTAGGLAEYYLPVSQNSSEKQDVKAYPNPVRPDFSGYVTISDIPEGSLVKIVDSGGNLVKELGIMSGFEIQWDLSNTNFQRVAGGVYYILISPGNESGSYSTVGKILVIS